jgi:hypothetical protein
MTRSVLTSSTATTPVIAVALGVDLAADQACHLVPNGTDIDRPAPVGGEPAGLLRSAEFWSVGNDALVCRADIAQPAGAHGMVRAKRSPTSQRQL